MIPPDTTWTGNGWWSNWKYVVAEYVIHLVNEEYFVIYDLLVHSTAAAVVLD